jgi:hypothetical protein
MMFEEKVPSGDAMLVNVSEEQWDNAIGVD